MAANCKGAREGGGESGLEACLSCKLQPDIAFFCPTFKIRKVENMQWFGLTVVGSR